MAAVDYEVEKILKRRIKAGKVSEFKTIEEISVSDRIDRIELKFIITVRGLNLNRTKLIQSLSVGELTVRHVFLS